MSDFNIRRVLLLAENKDKIESLKSVYPSAEVAAAEGGATNRYSEALAALQAEREAIYASEPEAP